MAEGDIEAFDRLYRFHWQTMFDAAFRRLKNVDQCKDLLQDVFTDLWVRRGKVDIENLNAYLSGAVRFQVFKRVAAGKASSDFFDSYRVVRTSPLDAEKNIADK